MNNFLFMEWQFKPPAKNSQISGDVFIEGERIECFIFLDDEAAIQRMDIKASELEGFAVPERLLGRWSRVVKAPDEEKREAQKQALATGEDIFLSLFAEGVEPSQEQSTLKQLLALMLERKRVLRAQGKPVGQEQRYLHVKSKEIYTVPMRELTPEQIMSIESQLEAVVV